MTIDNVREALRQSKPIGATSMIGVSYIYIGSKLSSTSMIVDGSRRHYKHKKSLRSELKIARDLVNAGYPNVVPFKYDSVRNSHYREISYFSVADVLHHFSLSCIDIGFYNEFNKEARYPFTYMSSLCLAHCYHNNCNRAKASICHFVMESYLKAVEFAKAASKTHTFVITPDNICPQGVYDFETFENHSCDWVSSLGPTFYCIERFWHSCGLSLLTSSIYDDGDGVYSYELVLDRFINNLHAPVKLRSQPTFDSFKELLCLRERHFDFSFGVYDGINIYNYKFDTEAGTEARLCQVLSWLTILYYCGLYDRGDYSCKYRVERDTVDFPIIGRVNSSHVCTEGDCSFIDNVYRCVQDIQGTSSMRHLFASPHYRYSRGDYCRHKCNHQDCFVRRGVAKFDDSFSSVQPVGVPSTSGINLLPNRLDLKSLSSSKDFIYVDFIKYWNSLVFVDRHGFETSLPLYTPYDGLVDPDLHGIVGNSIAASGSLADLDSNFHKFSFAKPASFSLNEFLLANAFILCRSRALGPDVLDIGILPYASTKHTAAGKSSGIGLKRFPQGFIRGLGDYAMFIKIAFAHMGHTFCTFMSEVIAKSGIQPLNKALRTIFLLPAYMNDINRMLTGSWLTYVKKYCSYDIILIGFKDYFCGVHRIITNLRRPLASDLSVKYLSQDYPKFDTRVDDIFQYSFISNMLNLYRLSDLDVLLPYLIQILANSIAPLVYYNGTVIRKLRGVSSGDGSTAIKNSHCNLNITYIASFRLLIEQKVDARYSLMQASLYGILVNSSKPDVVDINRIMVLYHNLYCNFSVLSDDTLGVFNTDLFSRDAYVAQYRSLGGYELTDEKLFVTDEPYEFTSRYFYKNDGFYYSAPLVERVFSSIIQVTKTSCLEPGIMGGRLLSILINAWPLTRQGGYYCDIAVDKLVYAFYDYVRAYFDEHKMFFTQGLLPLYEHEDVSAIAITAIDHMQGVKSFITKAYLDYIWFASSIVKQPLNRCIEMSVRSFVESYDPIHGFGPVIRVSPDIYEECLILTIGTPTILVSDSVKAIEYSTPQCMGCMVQTLYTCIDCTNKGFPMSFCNSLSNCIGDHIEISHHKRWAIVSAKAVNMLVCHFRGCDVEDITELYFGSKISCDKHRTPSDQLIYQDLVVKWLPSELKQQKHYFVKKYIHEAIKKHNFYDIFYPVALKNHFWFKRLLYWLALKDEIDCDCTEIDIVTRDAEYLIVKPRTHLTYRSDRDYVNIDNNTIGRFAIVCINDQCFYKYTSTYLPKTSFKVRLPNPSISISLYNLVKSNIVSENLLHGVSHIVSRIPAGNTGSVLDILVNTNISIVQGPPGTGKTTLILEVLKTVGLPPRGISIVVAAPSHGAVDTVAEGMSFYFKRNAMRLVPSENRLRVHTTLKEYHTGTGLIFTTLHSIKAINVGKVSYLIIDESSLASDVQIFAAISALNPAHLIICGDPNQLALVHPFTKKVAHYNYLNYCSAEKIFPVIFLSETYRMGSDICKFVSHNFYNDRLITNTAWSGHMYKYTTGDKSVGLVKGQLLCRDSLFIVLDWLEHYHPGGNIGILSTHHTTNSLIVNLLEEFDLSHYTSTITFAQGKTFDYVIFCVPYLNSFTQDANRFNVAVSRARKVCIVMAPESCRYLDSIPELDTVSHTNVYKVSEAANINFLASDRYPFNYVEQFSREGSVPVAYQHNKLALPFRKFVIDTSVFTTTQNLIAIDFESVNSLDIKTVTSKSLHFPASVGVYANGVKYSSALIPQLIIDGESYRTKRFRSLYPDSAVQARKGKITVEGYFRKYVFPSLVKHVHDTPILLFKSYLLDVAFLHNLIIFNLEQIQCTLCIMRATWFTDVPVCSAHVSGVIQAFYNPGLVDIHNIKCPRCLGVNLYLSTGGSVECNQCTPGDGVSYSMIRKLSEVHDGLCDIVHGSAHDSCVDSIMTICIYRKLFIRYWHSIYRIGPNALPRIYNSLNVTLVDQVKLIKSTLEEYYTASADYWFMGGGRHIKKRCTELLLGTSANAHNAICINNHTHIYMDSIYHINFKRDPTKFISADHTSAQFHSIFGLYYTLHGWRVWFSKYGTISDSVKSVIAVPLPKRHCSTSLDTVVCNRQFEELHCIKATCINGSFHYQGCTIHIDLMRQIDVAFASVPTFKLWQYNPKNVEVYNCHRLVDVTENDILTDGVFALPGYVSKPFDSLELYYRSNAILQLVNSFGFVNNGALLYVINLDVVPHAGQLVEYYKVDILSNIILTDPIYNKIHSTVDTLPLYNVIVCDVQTLEDFKLLIPLLKHLVVDGLLFVRVTHLLRDSLVLTELSTYFYKTHYYKAPIQRSTSELWIFFVCYSGGSAVSISPDHISEYCGRIRYLLDNPHKFIMNYVYRYRNSTHSYKMESADCVSDLYSIDNHVGSNDILAHVASPVMELPTLINKYPNSASTDLTLNNLDGAIMPLRNLLKSYTMQQLLEARCTYYIYAGIEYRGFISRNALKLANILYMIYPYWCPKYFNYFDMCCGVGGFSEWISYYCRSTGKHCSIYAVDQADTYIGSSSALIDESVHYELLDVCDFVKVNKFIDRAPRFNFITADGAIDTFNEEIDTFPLVVCECRLALNKLEIGGCFVLRVFGLNNSATYALCALVSSFFKVTLLLKPVLSRPATYERYIAFVDFKGGDLSLLDGWSIAPEIGSIPYSLQLIPANYLAAVIEFSTYVTSKQLVALRAMQHILNMPCNCNIPAAHTVSLGRWGYQFDLDLMNTVPNAPQVKAKFFINFRLPAKISAYIHSCFSKKLPSEFLNVKNLIYRAESYHLTLAVFDEGVNHDMSFSRIQTAVESLAAAALTAVGVCDVLCSTANTFGGRLFFLDVVNTPALIELEKRIRVLLECLGYGVLPRVFHPHISLCSVDSPMLQVDTDSLVELLSDLIQDIPAMTIDKLTVAKVKQ